MACEPYRADRQMRERSLLLVAMLSCAYGAGCGDVALPEPSFALRVAEHCEVPTSDRYYLPEGTFYSGTFRLRPELLRAEQLGDQMQRRFISRLLALAKAPTLSCGHDVEHAYRFIWLSTDIAPVIAGLTKVGDVWYAQATRFTSPRLEKAIVEARSERVVPDADVDRLLRGLRTAEFWTIPLAFTQGGSEADAWIIEGRSESAYRAVARAHLGDGAFKDVGYGLVRLSGLELPERVRERLEP
jgi:hypothetical protein